MRKTIKPGSNGKWLHTDKKYALHLRSIAVLGGLLCTYCQRQCITGSNGGHPMRPTYDHVQPHSKGGTNHESNLVLACAQCNSVRQDMSVTAFCNLMMFDRLAVGRRIRAQVRKPIDRAAGLAAYLSGKLAA